MSELISPVPPSGGQAILVLNSGSSSIKFALFDVAGDEHPILSGQVDGIGAEAKLVARDKKGDKFPDVALPDGVNHHDALDTLLNWLESHEDGFSIGAVGHRVVHGGEKYSQPVVLSPDTIAALETFVPLAPLHQPHNLAGIHAISAILPEAPQVACFDTAFHRTQEPVAQLFGLPRAITAEGVKRYGFHGLSYEYIARRLPLLSSRGAGRVVVAHLGNGASMCAMVHGRSVASTMGFTAVDGLMMGTRTGNIDPGVILYLIENKGMDAKALTKLLYKESGLLGVSGISQDMRTLLSSGTPEAEEAVDLFCYRIARELGSLAAASGGLDCMVFTGGIGEHSAEVRKRVCARTKWLGIGIDEVANSEHRTRISTPESNVDVLVVPTNEEWMIALHVRELLGI